MKRLHVLPLIAFLLAQVPAIAAQKPGAEIVVPRGYHAELVADGLTFPTAVAWDEKGVMHVLEAGYAYGPKEVGPGRVLRLQGHGFKVVANGLNAPATDIKFHRNDLYVAHRGFLSVFRSGRRRDLISGLPSGDHYTGEIAFSRDGWVLVGNGTVTNSGVVAEDNFRFGWASTNPSWHDIPPFPVTLVGQNFSALDLRSLNPVDRTETGAFMPFGTRVSQGQVVKGSVKASGVILRVRPDGNATEVFAHGLRNPFAMRYHQDGRLFVIDQGYDDRGVRPVANAPDPIYVVEKGGWYGWPDYVAGIPIWDERFWSGNSAGPVPFILKKHPPLKLPFMTIRPHTAAMRFDFAPERFARGGRMFVAAFGAGEPITGIAGAPTGSRVLCIDLQSKQVEVFAHNRGLEPVGRRVLSGFNRPIDLKFGPDGALYVVDFGVLEVNGQVPNAVQGTGTIWRISRS